jgi:hypothetical protein
MFDTNNPGKTRFLLKIGKTSMCNVIYNICIILKMFKIYVEHI